MPLSLLLALFLAFGADSLAVPEALPDLTISTRVALVGAWVLVVGGVASLVGWAVQRRCGREESARPTPGPRRLLRWGTRLVDALTLLGYAAAILVLGWPGIVRSSWGWRESILMDEALILAPFLAAQVAAWWGLALGDRAIRLRAGGRGTGGREVTSILRHVVKQARATFGMVLPATLVFAFGQDLTRRYWPSGAARPETQLALLVGLGVIVLALAPAFVRLSWPTRPLPDGPLRTRLERVSARFRFRCTDILVWDTDGAVVNAGVTGASPLFRYVLLSDALIDGLSDHEIAAVFGHEVGHARHRHLTSFGLFLIGSIGVLTLLGAHLDEGSVRTLIPDVVGVTGATLAQGGTVLGLALIYFGLLFGHLSRRFERQADVFGARAVSCDAEHCPPHPDPYAHPPEPSPSRRADRDPLCPVGLRTFINALRAVATLNGIDPQTRSWRHGSIAHRIAFLETLEDRPDAERRFQSSVSRLRWSLALVLGVALYLAFQTGAIDQLGL